MKSFITTILILTFYSSIIAQTEIRKEFDAKGVSELNISLKYPEMVKLKSWDKQQILITGKVLINMGENDDNFQLSSTREGKELDIRSKILDIDNLPRRIWAKEEDGTIHYFKSNDWNSAEVRKFLDDKNNHISISNGVVKDIQLEIFVPKDIALNIDCKFGLLEIQDFDGPLNANAKFGGIDISVANNSRLDIEAKTKFGEIYTNLDIDFNSRDQAPSESFRWLILRSALNGGGQPFVLESKHGDLYLRKKQ